MCVALRCRGSLESYAHATRESSQTKIDLKKEEKEKEKEKEKNRTLLLRLRCIDMPQSKKTTAAVH